MQNCKERNSSRLFEWTYKVLCREKNVKPLPSVQMYLQKSCLRFCADDVNLKDWSPLLNGIMQDRNLSKIYIYCRCRHKKIREKIDTEEKLMKLRRCARKSRQQPVLYTNFLLRCFVHSVAVCLRNSLMITSLALDGIPLASKYLRILSDGLINNRNLRSLSLARCRIGDAGCDILLESLQRNSSLYTLNLSSCCLTNRSATCLSLFFKNMRGDLLQNVWKEPTLSRDVRPAMEGLRVLILDRNYKFSDIGLQHLIRVLKNDFWLKTLCLRCCGITQQGGEIVLELLKTNSVLTHIDLRDNEVSSDMLQTIHKILKGRKSNGEINPMKKRLLSCRHVFMRNMVSESTKNKFSKNQSNRYARKMKRRKNRKYKSCNIRKRSHVKCINADRLKKHLSFMIKRNQNLVTILEDRTGFLMKEKNRRLKAEEVYHKIQPRLINLRNKIAIQNSIHLNMRYENQVYTNLQNMFNNLKVSTKEKVLKTDELQ